MICIGYAGLEAFDLILYISRTITKLNKRVLIIDIADTEALTKAMKHGMNLDSRQEIINYRDINYTRRIPSEKEFEAFERGVVIINFGAYYYPDFPYDFHSIHVVVNTIPHQMDEINTLLQKIALHETKINLLVRDIITIDDVDRVKQSLELPNQLMDISYLYLDINDYESAVQCQVTQIVRFHRITKGMEKYILKQVKNIFPKLKETIIKKAIKLAKKGV